VTRPSSPARWLLFALLLLAVLVRLPPLFGRALWYDDAVEGMMSQDILQGRFPFFFYGQSVHGTGDRFLAALVLLGLGSTPLALALAPLALMLGFIAAFWYAARAIFGPRPAAFAALYLAVPPFYLYGWSFDTRGHYHLMLIFGALSLLLLARIGTEGVAGSPRRRFVGLGFLAGVGWWTNNLGITFLAPVGSLLVAAGLADLPARGQAVAARAGLALGAFVVGAAPVAAYFLPRGLAPLPPGQPVGWAQSRDQLHGFLVQGLPQILGVHRGVFGAAFSIAYLVVAALVLGALGYAVGWALRHRAPGPIVLAALAGVLAVTVALNVFTGHGAIVRYPRYLLPLYLVLPVAIGLAADGLAGRSAGLAGAFLLPVLAVNLAGSLVLMRVLGDPRIAERERAWAARQSEQLAFLDRHGLDRLYDGPNLWTFLTEHRVLVSDRRDERLPDIVREVDAAERVGWIFGHPSPAFEESLRAAGFGHRRLEGPDFVVYTDFQPAAAHVEIEPRGWSAVASDRPEDAALAFDRRATTAWHSGRPQAPGMSYRLDLGRVETVGMVTWLPRNFQEVPQGLVIDVSVDGVSWRRVTLVAEYYGFLYWSGTHPFSRPRRGRVEFRFPPGPARFVRLTLTAGEPELAWSLREIMVGTPAPPCPPGRDPAALVRLLSARGVRFVHADHWVSANIARRSGGRIAVLPANLELDAYGWRPDPETIERVRLRPDTALVLDACPAQAPEAAAARLSATGVSFARDEVGGYAVFSGLRPPGRTERPVPWRADGAPGGAVLVTLARPTRASRLALDCREPMAEVPDVTVAVSADGRTFTDAPARVLPRAKLRMSGNWLFQDAPTGLVVELPPQPVQAVRLTRRPGAPPWCAIATATLGD
jgi:hypothetical protein